MSETGFQDLDRDTIEHRLNEITRDEGIGGDGDDQTLYNRIALERNRQEANNRANAFATQSAAILSSSSKFRDITHSLNQSNEAYNSNIYIIDNLRIEKKRMERLNADARREVHMNQQKYLRENYVHQLYIFIANMMLYTIVLISVVNTLVGLAGTFITPFLAYALALIALVVYALALYVEVNRHSMRLNPHHWARLYFPLSDDAGEKSGGGGGGGGGGNCKSNGGGDGDTE